MANPEFAALIDKFMQYDELYDDLENKEMELNELYQQEQERYFAAERQKKGIFSRLFSSDDDISLSEELLNLKEQIVEAGKKKELQDQQINQLVIQLAKNFDADTLKQHLEFDKIYEKKQQHDLDDDVDAAYDDPEIEKKAISISRLIWECIPHVESYIPADDLVKFYKFIQAERDSESPIYFGEDSPKIPPDEIILSKLQEETSIKDLKQMRHDNPDVFEEALQTILDKPEIYNKNPQRLTGLLDDAKRTIQEEDSDAIFLADEDKFWQQHTGSKFNQFKHKAQQVSEDSYDAAYDAANKYSKNPKNLIKDAKESTFNGAMYLGGRIIDVDGKKRKARNIVNEKIIPAVICGGKVTLGVITIGGIGFAAAAGLAAAGAIPPLGAAAVAVAGATIGLGGLAGIGAGTGHFAAKKEKPKKILDAIADGLFAPISAPTKPILKAMGIDPNPVTIAKNTLVNPALSLIKNIKQKQKGRTAAKIGLIAASAIGAGVVLPPLLGAGIAGGAILGFTGGIVGGVAGMTAGRFIEKGVKSIGKSASRLFKGEPIEVLKDDKKTKNVTKTLKNFNSDLFDDVISYFKNSIKNLMQDLESLRKMDASPNERKELEIKLDKEINKLQNQLGNLIEITANESQEHMPEKFYKEFQQILVDNYSAKKAEFTSISKNKKNFSLDELGSSKKLITFDYDRNKKDISYIRQTMEKCISHDLRGRKRMLI